MTTYVSSATFEGRDRNNELHVLDVAPPVGSVMRGWQDRESFVTDVMQRIHTGFDLFVQNDVLVGSDPTFVLKDSDHSYNYFRATVHKVYGGATPMQRSDAEHLLDAFYTEFNSVEDINNSSAVHFIRGNGPGVFGLGHTQMSTQLLGSNSSSGRMGIRNGNAYFRETQEGQVSEFRKVIVEEREFFMDVLHNDPASCIFAPTFGPGNGYTQLSADGTLDVLARCSCVLLGYWLRFSRSVLTNAILEKIGQQSRTGDIGDRLPTNLKNSKTKLLAKMVEVIAGCRGNTAFLFWSCKMDEPVADTEIFALCKRFETNVLVIEMGAFSAYKDAAVKESGHMAMLSRSEDIETLRRTSRDLRVMIYFKGAPGKKRFDRRDGHCMVMVCSHMCDINAHVDVVFDPKTEALMLGGQYNRFTIEMSYSPEDNPRAEEGYFDRLISERKPTPFSSQRRYHKLEAWDIKTLVTKDSAPRYRFINTEDEFVAFKNEMVESVMSIVNDPEMFDADDDDRVLGTTVLIDIECAQETAIRLFEMDERRIKGLVYFMSEFYRVFEERGVLDKIDFSQFTSSMSNSRTARLFGYQSQLEPDENGRIDCISGFDDLQNFSLSFKTPVVVRNEEGKKIGISRLFKLGCYSKSAFEVGHSILNEDWVQKQKKDQMWKVGGEVAKSKKGVDKAMRYEVYKEKCNDPNLDNLLALSITFKSITLARLGAYGKVLERINEVFGSYPPIKEEMLHVYDPQIDEPVVCHGALSGKKVPTGEGHWEMDARLFYSRVLMGSFDSMLNVDFFGNAWVFGSPKRAIFSPFEQDQCLASYEADFGYVFMSGIDFGPLKLYLGLNELCSWWKFAQDNPEKLERMVPCASIIHFTSYVVERAQEKIDEYSGSGVHPWMWDMRDNKKEMWVYVQHTVLCIENVYFYHGMDERIGITRFYEYRNEHRDLRMDAADRLDGLIIQPKNQEYMSYIRNKLKLAYTDLTKMFRNAGMDEEEARAATKMDFNRAIGIMKNGQYLGNVSSFSKTDVLIATKVKGITQYTFESIPMPRESLVQVCTRELPGTNKILSEMVHVTPVVLAGYPRSLRVDILERARLIMDVLVVKSNAFMVKTDAVFFKARYLPGVLDFVNEMFPGVYTDEESDLLTEADFVDAAAACLQSGCPPNRFCKEHDPTDTDESNLSHMLPFKFIYHPHLGTEGNVGAVLEAMVGSRVQFKYCEKVDGDTCNLKLSNAGWDSMRDAMKPKWETVLIKTSELMPTIDELADLGMLKGFANQVMGEDESLFDDVLETHCHIQGGDLLYRGDELCAQPYEVDLAARNDLYLARLFEKMDSFDGGFKLEGPPGAGKTYTVCEYIKKKSVECPETVFFVATATHLTLAPYRYLNIFKNPKINVSTFHSLVGVFNMMKEVSSNPRAWFTGPDKDKSRFVRETKGIGSAPVMIFIDEYEMMSQCTEEILLYLSDKQNVKMVLLGDRYQTAAFGLGIRCNGDVVKNITQDKCIEFDLPFRNLSYEYQMAHRMACNGKPTMFLEQPLSNYVAIPDRSHEAYQHCISEIVFAYWNAAETGKLYRDPVVSLQNYKAIGVVTLDIMEGVLKQGYMDMRDAIAFCGSNAFAMGSAPEPEFGSVDQETEEIVQESDGQEKTGKNMYHDRLNHMTGDPSSKGFLVGTYVSYEENFSYRSLTAFIPKIKGEAGVGAAPKHQNHVPMGQVMIFKGFRTKNVAVRSNDGNKRLVIRLEWGTFEKENGDFVVLTKAEVRAYMYYPFCLYTGGVVGHTFDRYTMIAFSNDTSRANNYLSLKRNVRDIENALGDRAWLSPVVKTLNVGVSRVTSGNQVNIIEISEGRQGFWRDTVKNSACHMLGVHMGDDREAYQARLDDMRSVVVESTHVFQLVGPIENLF